MKKRYIILFFLFILFLLIAFKINIYKKKRFQMWGNLKYYKSSPELLEASRDVFLQILKDNNQEDLCQNTYTHIWKKEAPSFNHLWIEDNIRIDESIMLFTQLEHEAVRNKNYDKLNQIYNASHYLLFQVSREVIKRKEILFTKDIGSFKRFTAPNDIKLAIDSLPVN